MGVTVGFRRKGWSLSIGWHILWVVPLLGYLLLIGFVYVFQERMVFFPNPGNQQTPKDWGLPFEEFYVDSGTFSIHGWWIPGKPDQPVILYSHGNASTISYLGGYASLFHRMGMGVLLYDYRGYGRSQGSPDEAGTYADAEAAWNHLIHKLAIPPRQVVFYGHSLGGGVATWLATQHPCRALVLEGSFSALSSLGKEMYPMFPGWVARISYDSLSRLAQVTVPVLIIHANGDEVIPIAHGRRLYEVAKPPKRFLETIGSHNRGFVTAGEDAWRSFQQFVGQKNQE